MKKPVALITGIAGFAGSHLADELLSAGYNIYGTYLPDESLENINHFKKFIKLYKLDILNASKCKSVFSKINPDYIFHLAAFSSVGQSIQKENSCFKINIDGSINVFQAASNLKKLKKIIFISSSEVYGNFPKSVKVLKEDYPCKPISPYAISKLTGEHIARYYHKFHNLPICIARSFNHSGPKQNENFVISAFSKQIALIEAGKQKPIISVGDLSAKRDLSDVRDIVHGYRKMAEIGKPGEVYLLCSSSSISIKEVLKKLLSLSNCKIKVNIDKSRVRKNDIPVIKGSNAKAVKELDYKSRYPLITTLTDSLNFWRKKISENGLKATRS